MRPSLPEAPDSPRPANGVPRAPSILVVDDEPDVAAALRGLLETSLPQAARILTASSAEDALGILAREHFDLVLCDYKLPGRSGIDLLREARERAPGTRRVLMTAYADLTVAVDAINNASVDNFIEKPFEPDEVVAKVERLLDEKRAVELREQAFTRALETLRKRVEQRA